MTYMNEDRQRECHKCERSYEGGKRIMTKYKDKYGNTYYVHIHEGGGWGVMIEDKLRKRIRWSRAGSLCGHETADQAQDALDKHAKNTKMRAL